MRLIQPFQGWVACLFFQGRSCWTNPGLNDGHPAGVAWEMGNDQFRVASGSSGRFLLARNGFAPTRATSSPGYPECSELLVKFDCLVPKLHLRTSVSPQLRCSFGEAQLRGQVRSQVQLGNEGTDAVRSGQNRLNGLSRRYFSAVGASVLVPRRSFDCGSIQSFDKATPPARLAQDDGAFLRGDLFECVTAPPPGVRRLPKCTVAWHTHVPATATD